MGPRLERTAPPLPDVVIGVIGVGIELPELPGVELRRLPVDALERIPLPAPFAPRLSRVSTPGRPLGRLKPEQAYVIESSECVREVGALLDRLVRDPPGIAGPCLLVAGPLPDALVDHALYAQVQLYPRGLAQADALFHALVVAAWLARDRMRRRPELGAPWATEKLAPWIVLAHGSVITERQAQVLALGSLGMNQREIALTLQIDRSTVEKHAGEVMERLGVASFEHAVQPISEQLAAVVGDGPVPPARLPRDLRKTAKDGNPAPRSPLGGVGTKGPRFRKGS